MRVTMSRVGVVLALAAVTGGGATTGAAAAQNGPFQIPVAAYARPLGGPIPTVPGCTLAATVATYGDCPPVGTQISNAVGFPEAEAGLGIPLGGVGAGSFMINQAGTFGPWNFGDDHNAEQRILSQAAFHIRISGKDTPTTLRTLATDSSYGSLPSAWSGLQVGQGAYDALYPFGWMTYKDLPANVSLRFWSPIVARDDYWSSLPVAYFDMRLANPTSHTQKISVMFTFPNATDHTGTGNDAPGYQGPATVRTGLTSSYHHDRRTGVDGVTLASDSPTDTADAYDSEWTIAARPLAGQSISYTTSWNAAGSGADVYAPFSSRGALPDRPLVAGSTAGAIAVAVTLKPHASTVVPFMLSWDFPQVSYGTTAQTVWMRRYTDFFGARETAANNYVPGSYKFHQSFRIADAALTHERMALKLVDAWWKPIATNPTYPSWLRTAALNEVNTIAWDGGFWEGGLARNTAALSPGGPRIGSQVPGTHLFFDLEGGGFADANCWDCYAYGYQMMQQLFPALDRDLLRGWSSMILEDPHGATPHDAGTADPWIQWSPSSGKGAADTSYMDEPAKYLFVAYAYWQATHDQSFLRFAYPAMLRTYNFLLAHIAADDHLPETALVLGDTYDFWPMFGHDVYLSELLLLADQVMIAATHDAIMLGIPAAMPAEVQSIQTQFPQSQAEFEADFWDPLHGYYRITQGTLEYSDGTMADAVFSQQVAQQLGLPDLLPPQHVEQDLLSAYPLLTQERQDGHLVGAMNGVNDLGKPIAVNVLESNETWVGVNWFLAATLWTDANRFDNPTLKADALQLGQAIYYQIYGDQQNGFAFDVPEAWGNTSTTAYRNPTYLRPRAVWDLLSAIKQPAIPTPARAPGGRGAWPPAPRASACRCHRRRSGGGR